MAFKVIIYSIAPVYIILIEPIWYCLRLCELSALFAICQELVRNDLKTVCMSRYQLDEFRHARDDDNINVIYVHTTLNKLKYFPCE